MTPGGLKAKTFAYFKTSAPARYRGRWHWVTIVKVEAFPAAYLRELVAWSYHRAQTHRAPKD